MTGKKGRRGWGWIRSLPSKRFQASYIGPDLLRHTAPRTYTAKMDAEHWLSTERRLIERDEWTPPAMRTAAKKTKAVTVADYVAVWIDHRNIKPRTKAHYRDLLARHIKDTLGRVPVRNLTPEAVRAWHAATLTDKPVMRSHAYGVLHAAMSTAVTDGLIAANPCHILGASHAGRKREPVILTVAEVAELADAIHPERMRALVLISAWCGLRWGEVTELRRKDIGKGAEVITVSRGVTHRDGVCRVDTPKSGNGRAVVVPPHIRADIEHHLETHVAEDAEALLFPPARAGCHLNDKTFRQRFAQALDAIGHDGVRIHDLRHFAGTQAARVGNLVETMGRLGHSTVAASLRYQQIVSGRDAAVAEALSKLAKDDTTSV
jgi:integrase